MEIDTLSMSAPVLVLLPSSTHAFLNLMGWTMWTWTGKEDTLTVNLTWHVPLCPVYLDDALHIYIST